MADNRFCEYCGAANRPNATFCRFCGKSIQNAATFSIASSTQINATQQHTIRRRYLILDQIGQGGFGAVYKASDTQFNNRLVAIKEMNQENLKSEDYADAAASFKQEAAMLSTFTHPNLPRIYDEFTEHGRSFLVMDFIEGETLESYLLKQKQYVMPLDRVLEIALQLCSVLDYLHSRYPPVIFRDLKPANIMLTPNGHIYLIDFGIARHFKPGQRKDTTSLGSMGYAAPEQYGRSQTTARSDIYSFGATLHQMLSGDDPSHSPFIFAPLHLGSQPALQELSQLIMSMAQKDISERPASIASVKSTLIHVQDQLKNRNQNMDTYQLQQPVSTAQPTTTKSNTRKNTKQQTSPVRPQSNLLYACVGHKGRVTAVGWSPDGQYIASTSYDKTAQIWQASNGIHLYTYTSHMQRVNDLSWSPDSKLLATVSDDASLRIWEPLTGKTVYTSKDMLVPVHHVRWSPDGKYLAYASTDSVIYIKDVQTHEDILTSSPYHNEIVTTFCWSPDSKQVAIGYKNGAIQIWDPFQKEGNSFWSRLFPMIRPRPKRLNRHEKQINGLSWTTDGYLASVSNDYQVLVWDVKNGNIISSPGLGTGGMLNAIAWGPDNATLAIASNDRTVQIWNTKTRTPYVYRGHTGYVIDVTWSPDGSRVASAGVDRTIQVWQVM